LHPQEFGCTPKNEGKWVHVHVGMLAYRSDHSPVYLTFQFTEHERGKGTWKFNNCLLRDEEYIKIVKDCIAGFNNCNLSQKGYISKGPIIQKLLNLF
jgi:hypothetical protein